MTALQTRLTNWDFAPVSAEKTTGMLLKIHPTDAIVPPLTLGSVGCVIGRDPSATITLEDESVSRRHCSIEPQGANWIVRDLGSTNGTFVNEERVKSISLQAGDRIRIGSHIYKYLTSDGLESQYYDAVFRMVTTDGLTQVYNKRYFLEHLERELARYRRYQDDFCILLMDLDKFKSVNDTYGHLAGDAVLVEFAKRASSVLRGGELFARYGGEEFVMLCARAKLVDAVSAGERIREATRAWPVHFEEYVIPITVSIGVASCLQADGIDSQSLLAVADQQLYRAKEAGRDRIHFVESAFISAS